MGWSGGSRIFDDVCDVLVHNTSIAGDVKTEILLALTKSLEEHDWHDYQDSEYINDPLVQSVFYEIFGWEPEEGWDD